MCHTRFSSAKCSSAVLVVFQLNPFFRSSQPRAEGLESMSVSRAAYSQLLETEGEIQACEACEGHGVGNPQGSFARSRGDGRRSVVLDPRQSRGGDYPPCVLAVTDCLRYRPCHMSLGRMLRGLRSCTKEIFSSLTTHPFRPNKNPLPSSGSSRSDASSSSMTAKTLENSPSSSRSSTTRGCVYRFHTQVLLLTELMVYTYSRRR